VNAMYVYALEGTYSNIMMMWS